MRVGRTLPEPRRCFMILLRWSSCLCYVSCHSRTTRARDISRDRRAFLISLVTSGSLPESLPGKGHSRDDNRALDHQLQRRTDAEQHQPVIERADDETAEQRAEHEAAATEQAATAERHGSNHIEFEPLHDIGPRRMRARGEYERREPG